MTKKLLLPILLILCILIAGCEPTIEQSNIISELPEEIIELVKEDPSLLTKYANGEIELPANVSADMIDTLLEENTPIEETITPPNVFDYILQGSGTIKDPYLIYTVEDLMVLQQYSYASLASHYMLMDDIYLSVVEYGESNWSPIGGYDDYFTGTFDGNGKVIYNLTIYVDDSSDDTYSISVGLFSNIYGSDAVVRNLGIENSSIFVKNDMIASVSAGFIAGNSMSGALIDNCHFQGSITVINTKSSYIGGIVGNSSMSPITNCYGDISTTMNIIPSKEFELNNAILNSYIGGIVGQTSGIIFRCYTKIDINVISNAVCNAGGIAGLTRNSISNCYSVGTINNSTISGGIVGSNSEMNFFSSIVENCFAAVAIYFDEATMPQNFIGISTNSHFSAGGIAGECYTIIRNCYAMGKIDVPFEAGGIVGYNNSTLIENCISLQSLISGAINVFRVSGTESQYSNSLKNNWGWKGIEIINNGKIVLSFFSHQSMITGGNFSIEDSLSPDFYKSLGWDFYSDNPIWTFDAEFGLPVLSGLDLKYMHGFDLSYFTLDAEKDFIPYAFQGYGTIEDPYLIYTADELALINRLSEYFLDSHYKLMNDITLPIPLEGESNWYPIGADLYPFKGTFDGNDKSIFGMTIVDSFSMASFGLFGVLDTSARVSNLNLVDVSIIYSADKSMVGGGIAAVNLGVIENCSVSGVIDSSYTLIIDYETIFEEDSTILLDYWLNISYMGGIVGANIGTVTKSHSNIDMFIEASGGYGGIAGLNSGTIKQTFSAGSIQHNHAEEELPLFLAYVGGIAGYNNLIIENCYSTGYLASQGFVGGIVGFNVFDNYIFDAFDEYTENADSIEVPLVARISNCYTTNEMVAGSLTSAGIAAVNTGVIESCVSLPQSLMSLGPMGIVVGTELDSDEYDSGILINTYTSNRYPLEEDLANSNSSVKMTTLSRLLQRSFYQSLGWDFTEIWDTKSGYGFPILKGVKGQENLVTPDTFK